MGSYMDSVDMLEAAEVLLESHRDSLMLDNFVKISLEVASGQKRASSCKEDDSPLAWIITLDPEKHKDLYDIHYSIIEGILTILLSSVGKFDTKEDNDKEKKGVISRLSSALASFFEEEEEDDIEEGEEHE